MESELDCFGRKHCCTCTATKRANDRKKTKRPSIKMTASSASSASSFSERSLQVLNLKDRFGSVPRFGHSSDFSNLYSTNQDEYNDYIVGLLTMGLIFLSIFMTWLLLLLVFKLCGAKVGFLSGTPFQATSLDDPKNGLAVNPWISLSRIIFGTSVFFMLVFGLLLITAGIGNLDTTTQTIGYGAEQGYEYLANAQFLLNEAFASIDLLKGFKDNLIVELKLFHVAIQQAKQVLEEGGDGYIEASVTLLITGMEALEDFLQEPLTVIDSSLVEGQQNCLEIQDATQTVDLTGIQMGIGIIVTLIPALALACLYHSINQHEEQQQQSQQSQQAQRRRSSMKEAAANTHVNDSCRTWFVWPTFLILTLICIGAGSAMSIVGLLNSDFCLGGDDQTPDSTIMAVLEKQGTPPESFEYRAIEFVVRVRSYLQVLCLFIYGHTFSYPAMIVLLYIHEGMRTSYPCCRSLDGRKRLGRSAQPNNWRHSNNRRRCGHCGCRDAHQHNRVQCHYHHQSTTRIRGVLDYFIGNCPRISRRCRLSRIARNIFHRHASSSMYQFVYRYLLGLSLLDYDGLFWSFGHYLSFRHVSSDHCGCRS